MARNSQLSQADLGTALPETRTRLRRLYSLHADPIQFATPASCPLPAIGAEAVAYRRPRLGARLSVMSDPRQHPHRIPPYASQQPAGQPGQPGQPGQHPQQHASQGYVLNGQSLGAAPATGNPAGRAGLIIGLIGLAIGIVMNVAVQVMVRTGGYAAFSILNGAAALVTFAATLAALILGLVGLRRAGAPLAAAGIATGLGIAGVVGIGVNFIVSSFSMLLYY